ncbi:hypothetical protein CR513_44187, partial [Mucuna pruriens]
MDGQNEVVNKILSQLLRFFTLEAWLPYKEFAYNKIVNETISHTPFELVYGYNPLSPLDLVPFLVLSKANLEGLSKVQSMVRLHKKVRTFRERQGKRYAERVNKDKEGRVFTKGMDDLNLRTNSFQEGESDTNQANQEELQKDLA